MKMMGKILEYSNKDSLGYIEGYDGIVYMFHQINVKNNIELKKGDIIEFNFIINGNKNMPYAVDIEKCYNNIRRIKVDGRIFKSI